LVSIQRAFQNDAMLIIYSVILTCTSCGVKQYLTPSRRLIRKQVKQTQNYKHMKQEN